MMRGRIIYLLVLISVVLVALCVQADTLCIEEERCRAHFETRLDVPDFNLMPATVVTQFIEMATSQREGNAYVAAERERKAFFQSASGNQQIYHATTGKILLQNRRYLSYQFNYCDFEGAPCGAANEGETTNVVFDCRTGRRLKAADIIRPSARRDVLNLIRLKLSQQFSGREFEAFAAPETRSDAELAACVSWARKGDIGAPWVSDNFCFTKDGVEWTYMPCEIVSAVHGTITVCIPWRDIAGHLSAELVR